MPRLVDAARAAGALGACLSGAGSTILAFTDSSGGIDRIGAAFLAGLGHYLWGGIRPQSVGEKVTPQVNPLHHQTKK